MWFSVSKKKKKRSFTKKKSFKNRRRKWLNEWTTLVGLAGLFRWMTKGKLREESSLPQATQPLSCPFGLGAQVRFVFSFHKRLLTLAEFDCRQLSWNSLTPDPPTLPGASVKGICWSWRPGGRSHGRAHVVLSESASTSSRPRLRTWKRFWWSFAFVSQHLPEYSVPWRFWERVMTWN